MHWLSIFSSFMMVLFLTGLVSVILLRTIKRDYARYDREEGLDDFVSISKGGIDEWSLQRIWMIGSWPWWWLWMETSTRWCFQTTSSTHGHVSIDGYWMPVGDLIRCGDPLHDHGRFVRRTCYYLDSYHLPLRIDIRCCRLHQCTLLCTLWW